MSGYFLDSSALAKRYLEEQGSPRVLEAFDSRQRLTVSRITLVEAASAVVRRAKSGSMDSELLRVVLTAIQDDFRTLLDVVDVGAAIVTRGFDLVRVHGLRAADAIQLASALFAAGYSGPVDDFVLMSSDKELNTAAEKVGLTVVDPES